MFSRNGEEGASTRCSRASAEYGRVSLECSSMIFSSCRRLSECEESRYEEPECNEEPELE